MRSRGDSAVNHAPPLAVSTIVEAIQRDVIAFDGVDQCLIVRIEGKLARLDG
jgi:hypothetical protein